MPGLSLSPLSLALGARRGAGGAAPSWSPADLPSLSLWLDAADVAGSDGDAVASWTSREGSAYAFEQATGSKRPVLKTGANGIGGRPVVRFDGTDDLLVHPDAPLTGTAGAVVVVLRTTNRDLDFQAVLSSCDEGGANRQWRIQATSGSPYLTIVANGGVNQSISGSISLHNAVPYIGHWALSGSTYTVRLNGRQDAASTVGTPMWLSGVDSRDNTVLGAVKRATESQFFAGDVAEVIVTGAALSDADGAALTAYLSAKYGIPAEYGTPLYYANTYGAWGDESFNSYGGLQQAIGKAAADGGGTVYLPPGRWRYDSNLVWSSGVSMAGEGAGVSVLLPYGSATLRTNNGSTSNELTGCTFEDFEIDGINQGPTHAVGLKGFYFEYCRDVHWARVLVRRTGATGFGSDFLVGCTFTDCIAEGCGRTGATNGDGCAGFGIGTGEYETEDTTFTDCVAEGNKRYGIFFEQQNGAPYKSAGYEVLGGRFDGNRWGVGDCGITGLVVDGAQMNENTLNGFINNGPSLSGIGGDDGVVQNCTIHDNGALGLDPATPSNGYTYSNNDLQGNGT